LRHELVALHDAQQQYNGVSQSGAQFYPVCYNVEIIGNGTATPEGRTFPGMYAITDPGIKMKLKDAINGDYVSLKWFKVQRNTGSFNAQIAPGIAKYAGKYDPPTGPKPIVKETGEVPANIRAQYNKRKAVVSFISEWTVVGGDYHVPGEGEKPKGTFNAAKNFADLTKGLAAINAKPLSDFA
jgi:hypothetical protein